MTRSALMLLAGLMLAIQSLPACEQDGDCGPGGTCIKRERRASGVCYGVARATPGDAGASQDHAGAGPADANAVQDPGYRQYEDAVRASDIPCVVTQDCPAGMDCVFVGGESACLKLP